MSKRKAVSWILMALLVLLSVWYPTLKPEIREAIMGMLAGR